MKLVEGDADVDDVGEFVARLGAVGEEHDVTVQAFDARYVVSRAHLERAVELADRAIARGENVARERAVEILLYAAGRRQIDQALAMGVDEGRTPVVVLVDAGAESGDEAAAATALTELLDAGTSVEAAETLDDYDEDVVRDFFGLTETELAATTGTPEDAVLERVALLEVNK